MSYYCCCPVNLCIQENATANGELVYGEFLHYLNTVAADGDFGNTAVVLIPDVSLLETDSETKVFLNTHMKQQICHCKASKYAQSGQQHLQISQHNLCLKICFPLFLMWRFTLSSSCLCFKYLCYCFSEKTMSIVDLSEKTMSVVDSFWIHVVSQGIHVLQITWAKCLPTSTDMVSFIGSFYSHYDCSYKAWC